MSMDKLLLVDGSNLLFQMFYGMPARIKNKDGKSIHGVLGFVGALLKIIRMTSPTHIVVLFDGEHENERTDLNAEYKANRIDYSKVAEEENPFSQLADIYTALDYLGIKHAETTTCETDDWMAGYAFTYGQNMKIVISSFDSDYFQLITDNVSVLRYRGIRTSIYNQDFILKLFGIFPSQYADFKALVGDKSDNIKGVENVGLKTAALLLRKYTTLENVLANAEQIERLTIRNSIIAAAERVRTNYKLIKLKNGAELPFRLDEFACNVFECTTNEILKGINLLP